MDPSAPLLVTDDSLLVSEVQRLAAAAGVVPVVVREAALALRHWPTAVTVLVGADAAEAVSACRAARRDQVHLLASDPVPDPLFRAALALGAESVVALPSRQDQLVQLLTDAGDGARRTGCVTGVVGGSGGAGATVFAAALAQACAERGETLLVDADALGAGADRVLGLEAVAGIRWDAVAHTAGRLSARALREALPRAGRLAVLTWSPEDLAGLSTSAVREVLSAAVRGFDSVVLDLPRHPDPLTEELLARCDHVVVVAALTVPGVSAAARLAGRLPASGPRLHLVTRGRRGGVDAEAAADLLGLPLVAEMSDQRGLDESVDLGAGPARARRGPLARAARTVAGLASGSPAPRAAGVPA